MRKDVARDSDVRMVAECAERLLPLNTAILSPEYFYQSLPLCVIDAVYSIGVRYCGTRSVVIRYCEFTNQRRIRDEKNLPALSAQESVSAFCSRPEQDDPEEMAERVYQNRQRTSSRKGILKADAVARFARCLRSYQVEYFQDLPRVAENERFEADIKEIPGQGSGISLQYFWMLAGSEQFIKPDRMVRGFLQSALSRPVTVEEATPLVRGASEQLTAKYPELTPRLLDHEIWKHQRGC